MSAALYTRISKDPLEEGAGVDRQEADCRRMLAQEGVGEPLVFRDNDRSAWQRDRKRPAWDDMLAQVRVGEITMLAVWHPDRLMRQPRDLEELIEAADHGLRLLCAGGGRDLANPDDRLVLRILVAAACKASDDSSRRIKRAFDDRAAAGLSHSGERLFGLTADRAELVPDEAAAIRDAAARVLAGESLRSICADLDGRFTTVRGSTTWTHASLRGVLLRPSVAGFLTRRGETVGRAAWPAVLDEPTWRAVCDTLLDPERLSRRTAAHRHLLSGLLYCTRCAAEVGGRARLRSLKQTGSPTRRRYACPNCFRNAVSETQLDAYVLAAVDERLAATTPPQPATPSSDTSELDAARARLELVTREFADDPDVSPAQLRILSKRLRDRIRVLEAQAARAGARSTPLTFDGWMCEPPDRQRTVVAAVVERIDVAPAGKAGRYLDPSRLDITYRDVS